MQIFAAWSKQNFIEGISTCPRIWSSKTGLIKSCKLETSKNRNSSYVQLAKEMKKITRKKEAWPAWNSAKLVTWRITIKNQWLSEMTLVLKWIREMNSSLLWGMKLAKRKISSAIVIKHQKGIIYGKRRLHELQISRKKKRPWKPRIQVLDKWNGTQVIENQRQGKDILPILESKSTGQT